MSVTAMHAVCNNPLFCVNYKLERVNRTTTQCVFGNTAANCPVRGISWDLLGLSKAKVDTIEAAIAHSTDATGPQVLVRGSFKSFIEFTMFQPTEVWVAQRSGGSTDGTFVRIFDRGIRCITAPCPQFAEGRLNSTRTAVIDGIDFGVSAEDSLQQRTYDATSKPDGVIIVGDRTTRAVQSYSEKYRSVQQVFLRLN